MSKRYSLVKVVPRRFIPDSETSLVSGSVYRTTFVEIEPTAVYQNTTSLSFTYTSGQLDFTVVAGAPNSNIFIDYPLYFSVSESVIFHDNPVSETGGLKEWLPRLDSHVSIKQSGKDILFGVLSISSSSVRLINEDYGLAVYFTKYDNYLNRPFYAYGKIGDGSVFLLNSATIKSVSYGKKININIKDNLDKLEDTATMGNAKLHYEFNATDYPNGNAGRYGQAIPIAFGRLSQSPGFLPLAANPDYNIVDETGTFQAIESHTTDKEFIIGVATNPYPPSGTTVAVTDNGTILIGGTNFRSISTTAFNLKVVIPGCNIAASVDNAVTWVSRQVHSVFPGSGIAYIFENSAITHIKIPSCYFGEQPIYDNSVFPTQAVMICNHDTTASGDTFIWIEPSPTLLFFPEFMRTISEQMAIITNDTDISQTDYMERLFEDAGFNSAIKGNAQTLANNYVQVTHGLNKKMESYRDLIQNMSYSNNGIAYTIPALDVSDVQDIGYRIIYDSMSSDADITIYDIFTYEILEPEIKRVSSFQDIRSKITCENPTIINNASFFGTTATAESDFTENIYSIKRELTYDSYVIDAQDSVDKKLDIIKEPILIYEFSLDAIDFIDKAKVGDIFRLKDISDKLPIQTNDLDLFIIGVERSATTIRVTGYDFAKIS